MKKGQELTFAELWARLSKCQNIRWRLWGVGGTFAYINQAKWNWQFEARNFDHTDGGHKTFRFAAFDEENHFLMEVPFSNFEDMIYEIKVINENPLRLSIMWDDGEDNLLTIWEKL